MVEELPPLEDSGAPERTSPERIGRYELCFELASGGMATVYLARIDGLSGFEKLIALKRIHRHLAKEKGYVDMFLDEAKISSRITHPNVCSVFDFGEAEGEYYIAMEYLVGEPLSRLCTRVVKTRALRRDPILPLRMARIIADACEGLHAAHELKDANGDLLHVVHRDVSPRNLFVTYDGAVQVVDFGIASARQRLHHTATGKVKGTFAYMAPEQLTADPIDRRVDIWALGVTLWEMLAVKRLFRRDTTANTIHSVLYDEILPPSDFRAQVPKALDDIVMKALARDPKERWQTAREMGRALRQFLGTQPEVIDPAELSEWMAELFPQGEARKSQLMEVARMAHTAVPAMPQVDETDVTLTATGLVAEGQPLASRTFTARWAAIAVVALGITVTGVAAVFGFGGVDPTIEQTMVDTPLPSIEAEEPSMRVEVGEDQATPSHDAADADKGVAGSLEDESIEETPKPRTNRRARATQRAKTEFGTINLVTRGGWAQVYKGNKSLGSTPTRLTLPGGRHKLVLKPFGDGKPKTVFVNVQAGKIKQVSISFD